MWIEGRSTNSTMFGHTLSARFDSRTGRTQKSWSILGPRNSTKISGQFFVVNGLAQTVTSYPRAMITVPPPLLKVTVSSPGILEVIGLHCYILAEVPKADTRHRYAFILDGPQTLTLLILM